MRLHKSSRKEKIGNKMPEQKFKDHKIDCAKKSYNKREAQEICNRNKNSGKIKRGKYPVHYYYCPIHNAWHLSSKFKKKSKNKFNED